MKNSILKFIQVILLITCIFSVQQIRAQTEKYDSSITVDDEEEYEEDEETIEAPPEFKNPDDNKTIIPSQRIINSDSIRNLKTQPAFAYMVYLDSLLKAYQFAADHQPPPPENLPEDKSIFDFKPVRFIFYAAAIALVGFVLYRLFFGQGLFARNRKQELPDIELEETPDETDLEKSLRVALSRKDYRLAVRYLFLQTLYGLGEKGALHLSTEKTNYQYLLELSSKKYASQFAQLSLQYEYVWFGNFPVDEARFSSIQQQHQQFLKQI